jgi:phospholipid transport system substrate-binding protein
MSRAALVSVSALALLLAAQGLPVEAGPATDSLRATYTQANRIISNPATVARPSELLPAFRALFGTAFDFRGAAEDALGPEWRTRTANEQREFTSLFASFVQRGFVFWLASVADITGGGITVQYLGESGDRERALVRTAIGRRGGRQIPLDHDMIYVGRRWMVRDVTIDGISLVPNYRAQFDRVIRASSYPELLARLRGKVAAELPSPAAPGPEPPGVPVPPPPPFEMR